MDKPHDGDGGSDATVLGEGGAGVRQFARGGPVQTRLGFSFGERNCGSNLGGKRQEVYRGRHDHHRPGAAAVTEEAHRAVCTFQPRRSRSSAAVAKRTP